MARTILTIGALVIGVAATVHGATGKKVDPTKMTCAEFVALTEEAQPRVVAWLDGYSSGAKAKPEAVPVVVKREIAHIVEECTETPKQSLWDKIRGKLPGGKKTVANPAKMTCEEFVALEKPAQPEVAYWMDGYNEGAQKGQPETKGAKAADGEATGAADVALDADVVAVVEECRVEPKQALSDEIKKKF